jgi:hypothetical protein
MAFCNSCGAAIAPGTRFCNKCGAVVLASSPAPSAMPPAPASSVPPTHSAQASAPTSGGGALKAVLIVLGVLVLVAVLGVTSAFFAWRITRHAHIRHERDHVNVETPFGNVETTADPQEAARSLGVDLYPGVQVLKEGSTSATFGGVHTASVKAESTDSLDKVCTFYKSRFRNAMVVSSDENQCTIVSRDKKNMVTINAKADGGKTVLVITNVSNAEAASPSSN